MLALYCIAGHNPSSALPRPPQEDEVIDALPGLPLPGLPLFLFHSVCWGHWGHLSSRLSGLQRTVAEMTDGRTHSGFTIPVTFKVSAGPVCRVHSQACPLTSESGTWTGWGWVLVCGTQFSAICQCSGPQPCTDVRNEVVSPWGSFCCILGAKCWISFCFKEIKEQCPFFQVVVYVLVEKTEGNKLILEFFACCGERALF